jgi:drug/metabolite transporter (DMT)-like permease
MRILVYIMLCLIWGSTWKAIQIGLSVAPPLTTAAARFLLAMGILTAMALLRKLTWPSGIREWLRVGYPGLWMYGISYALIYFAEGYITSSLTAVLFGSFPFWVALLAYFRIDEERIRPLGWLGILIGFVGVVLISYDQLTISGELFKGTLLAIGGCYAAAHGVILHRKHFVERNIVVTAAVQMLTGGAVLVGGSLMLESLSDFHLSAEAIGSVIYLAVFGTVVAFVGYYWLLTKMRTVTVSLIAFVTPLVAIGVGIPFGEELTPVMLVGTALILSGIVLVVHKRRPLPTVDL